MNVTLAGDETNVTWQVMNRHHVSSLSMTSRRHSVESNLPAPPSRYHQTQNLAKNLKLQMTVYFAFLQFFKGYILFVKCSKTTVYYYFFLILSPLVRRHLSMVYISVIITHITHYKL